MNPLPKNRKELRNRVAAVATGSAAWWLTGWQRKYRTLAATNDDDVCRVIRRLATAEDRYQSENKMGKYATDNFCDISRCKTAAECGYAGRCLSPNSKDQP